MIPPCMMMMMQQQRRYQRHFSRLNHTNDHFYTLFFTSMIDAFDLQLSCNGGGGRARTEHIKALRASTSQPLPPPAQPTPTPPSVQLHLARDSFQHAVRAMQKPKATPFSVFVYCCCSTYNESSTSRGSCPVAQYVRDLPHYPAPRTPLPLPAVERAPFRPERIDFFILLSIQRKKHVARPAEMKWVRCHCALQNYDKLATCCRNMLCCCYVATQPPRRLI